MKKQYAWLLAAIMIAVLAASVYARSPSLEILRLSDHDLTEPAAYSVFGVNMVSTTSSSNAHVLWEEWAGVEEQKDVFYRQLPSGNTIHLSDTALTEGLALNLKIASAPNGRACAVWREDAGNVEETDLFYWDSETADTTRLSDPDLSASLADRPQLLCNDNRSDVVWRESIPDDTSGWGKELFYWSSTTGETRMLSDPETWDGVVTIEGFVLKDGVTHVTWAEWVDSEKVFHLFYWNSASTKVVDLGEHGPDPDTVQLVVDQQGVAHLFWVYQGTISYWNSEEALTTIIDTGQDVFKLSSAVGETGPVHLVWDYNGLTYWNTTMTEPTIVGNSEGFLQTTLFTVGSTAHVIWGDGDYWDSETQDVVDLSSFGSGSVHPLLFEWRVDDAGTVHFAWGQENDVWYWNSTERVARMFSDPAAESQPIYGVALAVDDSGTAHVAWGEGGQKDLPVDLFYVNTSQVEATTLATVTREVPILQIVVDGAGMPHVGWMGEHLGSTLYHWHPEIGITTLSTDEDEAGQLSLMRADNGVVYATWVDGTEGEGSDAFALVAVPAVPSHYDQKVYLPVLMR